MKHALSTVLFVLSCTVFGYAQADPILHVSPQSLPFTGETQTLQLDITNSGDGQLEWMITPSSFGLGWLSVEVESGVNDAQVTVSVDRTGLANGVYFGALQVSSNAGDVAVEAILYVANAPILSVTPTFLAFSTSVSERTIELGNSGVGTLHWAVSADQPWISIAPALAGSGPATLTVNVDVSVLARGLTHFGEIAVNSNGGSQIATVRADPPLLSSGGTIGLYADRDGIDCSILDSSPGLVNIYVVHTNLATASGSEFSTPLPNCMLGASWISDTAPFPVTIGNSQTGVAIGYGACLSAPIHILTISVLAAGSSAPCCVYPVLAHSGPGQIAVTDCATPLNLLVATGREAVINAGAGCSCGTVPTREATWGQVKALFGNE